MKNQKVKKVYLYKNLIILDLNKFYQCYIQNGLDKNYQSSKIVFWVVGVLNTARNHQSSV